MPKTPNLNTIKQIDSDSLKRLGRKISDHPSYKHRTPTLKIIGVLLLIAMVGIGSLILSEGWSHWWWIAVVLMGLIAYMFFEKRQIFGISIHENGIAFFEDNTETAMIRLWSELEFGETPWEHKSEFYFKDRVSGEPIVVLETNDIHCNKQAISEVLQKQPSKALMQFWDNTLQEKGVVEYKNVTLQKDGVLFKETNQLLPYSEFHMWTVDNDTWQVVYQTTSGRLFRPKLFTYQVPFVSTLFDYARKRSQSIT